MLTLLLSLQMVSDCFQYFLLLFQTFNLHSIFFLFEIAPNLAKEHSETHFPFGINRVHDDLAQAAAGKRQLGIWDVPRLLLILHCVRLQGRLLLALARVLLCSLCAVVSLTTALWTIRLPCAIGQREKEPGGTSHRNCAR